jgi:enoyl-CoA hydratase/carnithine racemase
MTRDSQGDTVTAERPQREALTLEIVDGVATVELSRPDDLNRFDNLLHDELEEAIAEIAVDPDARALLLCGSGKVFSGGGDAARMLAAAQEDPHARMVGVDRGRRLFRLCTDFPKPFVAAVHGDVFGVATSLVLTADALVSTPGVKFVDPHVHMGLVAGDGGAIAWPINMPAALAKRHLLWGEPMKAEDAHRVGLVTDLVDTADQVRPHAEKLAARVAALPPVAVQLTKRTLNKVIQSRIDEAFDLGFYLEAITVGTEDMVEAVNAFLEKRRPTWKGR